jgi:hypothetical protein
MDDWIRRAQEIVDQDAANQEDRGTCVLGAGIKLEPGGPVVIRSPFQGNLSGFYATERAVGWLRSKGIPALWYDGVMD